MRNNNNREMLLLNTSLGVFNKYFKKKGLIEISINKPHEVWTETYSGWSKYEDKKITMEFLKSFALQLAIQTGQKYNYDSKPMLSCQIPIDHYSYRVQIASGTSVKSGFLLSIRIGNNKIFPLKSYFNNFEIKKVNNLIDSRKSFLVAGGTGSGKTTLLNSVLDKLDENDRVITIEDVAELNIKNLNQGNFILSKTNTGTSKMTYEDVLNVCMRLRPDRIILGELDTRNVSLLFNLLNTGHAGVASTIHANSANEARFKIVQLLEFVGYNITDNGKKYIEDMLQNIIFIKSEKDIKKQIKVFKAFLNHE